MITLDLARLAFKPKAQPELSFLNLEKALGSGAAETLLGQDADPLRIERPAVTAPSPVDSALLQALHAQAGIGLWSVVLHEGNPMDARSQWCWSDQFRRALGFETHSEFPDVIFSWIDRIHPDDASATIKALHIFLDDDSKNATYETAHQLKLKDSSYRWFRLVGVVRRDASGKDIHACGLLTDAHDLRILQSEHSRANQQLSEIFEARIASETASVAKAADAMQSLASELPPAFSSAVSQTAVAATDAAETEASVTRAAANADKIALSMGGIREHLAELNTLNAAAFAETTRAGKLAQALSVASLRLCEVMKLLSAIAGQTNLIALNATVEAARFGEAGKGFAIIAGETKELAAETTRASEDITLRINSLQDETRHTVAAIASLGAAVTNAAECSLGMTRSLESHGIATNENALHLRQTAVLARKTSKSINGVGEVVNDLAGPTPRFAGQARELAHSSSLLCQEANEFALRLRGSLAIGAALS